MHSGTLLTTPELQRSTVDGYSVVMVLYVLIHVDR